MKPIARFFNTPKIALPAALLVAIVAGFFAYKHIHKTTPLTFVSAESGTISEQNASAPKDLTLGFVAGGRIASVNVKVGDTVHSGEVLAALDAGTAGGSVTQARAAYASAQAAYEKVINGATGPALDISRAQVHSAQVALTEVTAQQNLAVENAYRTLLNASIAAESTTQTSAQAPTISGTYTKDQEGTITLIVYPSGDEGYFTFSGLVSGTGNINTSVPQPIGDTGLSILFPRGAVSSYTGTTWTITLPNTTGATYLASYNAYQSALQTKTQTIAQAEAALDQANANLTAQATAARPEDVAAAEAQVQSAAGALQIAEAAYKNTVITAPGDGMVTAVSITPGQIAIANAPAIELYGSSTEKAIAVMVPKNAVLTKNGKSYVLKQAGAGTIEQEVTLGISDSVNVEITSGLVAGDKVATH